MAFSLEQLRQQLQKKISRPLKCRALFFQFVEVEEGFLQIFGSRIDHVLVRRAGTGENRGESQGKVFLISVISVASCWFVPSVNRVVDRLGQELGNPFRS